MNNTLRQRIINAGQGHLVEHFDKVSVAAQANLERQFNDINWEELPDIIANYVLKRPVTDIPSDLTPSPFFSFPASNSKEESLYAQARIKGAELIRDGKVGLLTVAGGQGTRLGFDGPKGTYPITPVLHKTLFQYFAESNARTVKKYQVKSGRLHWFIMCSELNYGPTMKFFEDNDYFGIKDSVHFFVQGTMPAIGLDGKLIIAAEDSLALAPNGHGGTFLAVRKSGMLDLMKKLGIEYLSYFQVDNPLVPVADSLFVGLHALEGSEMSSRMLAKTGPYEKLGNFCITNGALTVIEYSDMPDELANRRNANGELEFVAGSPAIHVISVSFIEKLTENGTLRLPWHRADKKVPYLGPDGQTVKPETPNAVKVESFIFDALPLAAKAIVFEGIREEIFGPTKNATGVDSAESCRALLVARDARRLKAAGYDVPMKEDGFTPDVIVELDPKEIIDEADAVAYFKQNPLKEALKPGDVKAI